VALPLTVKQTRAQKLKHLVQARIDEHATVILGKVTGDVSIFDRPGPVTIRVERAP